MTSATSQAETTVDDGRTGRSYLSGGLLVAGGVWALVGNVLHPRFDQQNQAAVYRADIAAAQATNVQLASDVAAKKTDDYVVNKARDYGYVLPGEALIGVQQETVAPVVAAIAPAPSHLQKWLALFFGAR